MEDGEQLELAGKLEQALFAYARDRSWEKAARLAGSLGRNLDAGRYWLEAKKPYEAAVCFRRVGALKECQEALLHVPPTSARYRDACVHAVSVATILGTPPGTLLSFLMPFINSLPATNAEAAALTQLADGFGKTDKVRLAASIYRSVLQKFPGNIDAKEGLDALPVEARPSAPPSSPAPSAPSRAASAPAPGAARPSAPRPSAPAARAGRSQRLHEILVAQGKLSKQRMELVLRDNPQLQGSDVRLGEALVAGGLVSALDVVQALSEQTGIPYIADEKLYSGASPVAAQALSADQAEKWQVAPISLVDRHLYVAMKDPRDVALVDKVRFASGMSHVTGIFATDFGIRRTLAKLYHGDIEGLQAEMESWKGAVHEQMRKGEGPTPFSDRHTGTREHQFDTREFEARLKGVDVGAPPPAAPPPPPAAPPSSTIAMPQAALPAVGATFAGRYQLQAVLGEGGSASVFRAMDAELGEPVALKLFRPTGQAESEDVLARFKLELSLSRLLAHPNIIRLYDLGFADGWRYLTMELLEGLDLGTRMAKTRGPLPLVEGLRYLEQVCVALQAAHDRGVVHRDIKPQNLFVTTDGQVKLMDFGIAKKVRSPGVTVAGMVMGTPEFISPEQINSFSTVTHLTDLYSLGATAYALFTGQPPFAHPELVKLLMAQANEPPMPPRERNPAIPEALDGAILRLLAKDPAARFASARDAGEALRAIREALEAKPR